MRSLVYIAPKLHLTQTITSLGNIAITIQSICGRKPTPMSYDFIKTVGASGSRRPVQPCCMGMGSCLSILYKSSKSSECVWRDMKRKSKADRIYDTCCWQSRPTSDALFILGSPTVWMAWLNVGSRYNIGALASEDLMLQILGCNALIDLHGGFVKAISRPWKRRNHCRRGTHVELLGWMSGVGTISGCLQGGVADVVSWRKFPLQFDTYVVMWLCLCRDIRVHQHRHTPQIGTATHCVGKRHIA